MNPDRKSDDEPTIRKRERRWRLWHFVLIGVVIGLAIPASDGISRWLDLRSILQLQPPDGLPPKALTAYETFKHDLVCLVQGTEPGIVSQNGVTILQSPLLEKEFPEFVFLRVRFGWKPRRDYTGCVCAMPLSGGPNWCFIDPRLRLRDIVAFLASTGRKLQSEEDARMIRQIVGELTSKEFLQFLPDEHEQVSESLWRIGIDRKATSSKYLEIGVDSQGVVNWGILTSEPLSTEPIDAERKGHAM